MAALASVWAVPLSEVAEGAGIAKPDVRLTGSDLVIGRISLPLRTDNRAAAAQVCFATHHIIQ